MGAIGLENMEKVAPSKQPSGAFSSQAEQQNWLAFIIIAFAVLFNLYHLYPEVAIDAPPLNDNILHWMAIQGAAWAMETGADPTDFWLPSVGLGYPLFHHYQHLGHILPALLHHLTGQTLSLPIVFNLTSYSLLCIFPLSIYWSMRRFGFTALSAAMAGLAAPLVSTPGLFGLEFGSYIWRGSGLYTQLWGMLLLPPALAQGYHALRTGRGFLGAVLLLSTTIMAHLVFGYMAAISLLLLALINPSIADKRLFTRLGRVVLLLLLVVLVASYFLAPFWLDRAFMNRSIWEEASKYDSYGYEWVLRALARGELFDYGRFPSFTILVALGFLLCLGKWSDARYRVPVVLFSLWLLLYFGRPTWGVLLDLLPLSNDLHFHRLIAGIHLGGIYLIGIGLGIPWQSGLAQLSSMDGNSSPLHKRVIPLSIIMSISGLVLYPAYVERGAYLAQNALWRSENQAALRTESMAIGRLLDTLDSYPPGRVYVGQGNNWGNEYTVGAVPMYSLLSLAGLDMLGYNYHALSLNTEITVLFDETRLDHYELFNVRYVVAPSDRSLPEFVKPIGDYGRHRLYQVETSGYFDLVTTNVGFSGEKKDFYAAVSTWLYSSLPAQKLHPTLFIRAQPADSSFAILPLSEAAQLLPNLSFTPESVEERGEISDERVAGGSFAAQVQAFTDCTLLLKATFHPGWRFWVDGIEMPPVMVMPSYIGIPIKAGQHQVLAEYHPEPLRYWLFALGLLTLALIALAEWRGDVWLSTSPAQKFISVSRQLERPVQQLLARVHLPDIKLKLCPHLPYLWALSLLTLLAGLPTLQFDIMSGHDALEYLPRTVEFYENLKHWIIIPRWAPDLSAGYGQPFFSFNPPLFYYLASILRIAGVNFVASQNLAILTVIFIAGLGMYLLAREAYGNLGGLVSSAAYLFAPYFLVNLYVRHALADFTAFAWIPLAFWGLYRYAIGHGKRFLAIGTFSLALLILSSNPVALITFPFVLLMLAWVTFREQDWHIFRRGCLCMVLGLGLSAYFWLPALAERNLVHLDRLKQDYLSYSNHFVYPFQLIYSLWDYGLSLAGAEDGMSFAVGPLHLLFIITALLLYRRIRKNSSHGAWWVSFALVLSFVTAFFSAQPSSFIWRQAPLLQYLEFPWRFLSLVAAGTALLFGYPFLLIPQKKTRWANALAILLIAALLFCGLPKAKPASYLNVDDSEYTPREITAKNLSVTTAREYEPIWVQERPGAPATAPLTLQAGSGRILSNRVSPIHIEAQAIIYEPSRIRVNTFYFPGWCLYIDGIEKPIDISIPQGAIDFTLDPGEHSIQILFKDTPVRLWSRILSFLVLIILLWLIVSKSSRMLSKRKSLQSTQPIDASSYQLNFETQTPEPPGRCPEPVTRGVKIPAGLYLLLLSIYLITASGHFLSTDHVAVHLTAQSLVEDHDLAIQPLNDAVIGPDGQWYAAYGPLTSILSIPLYLVGKYVDAFSSSPVRAYWSGEVLGDWGGTVPIFFVSLFNQFVMPLVCLLVYLFGRQIGFSQRRAAAVALILGVGTLAWSQAHDFFQHPLESLWLLLAIYILFANRQRLQLRHALASGISLALGALTRVNLLMVTPAIGLYLFYLVWNDPANRGRGIRKSTLRYGLAFSLPILFAFVLLLYLNQVRFGEPFAFQPTAARRGLADPIWVGFYVNLLSPGRSIFLYSLPLLAALANFKKLYNYYRAEALLFLSVSGIYLVVYSLFGSPEGGWSWGPRYLWAIVPLLIIPIGYCFDNCRSIIFVILITLLGAMVQFLGVVVNWSYVHWDWLNMGYDTASNTAYFLYIPQISPIPMHLEAFLEGRYIDLWLSWVYQQYGATVLLYSLALPILLAVTALTWLHPLYFSVIAYLKKSLSAARNSDHIRLVISKKS